MYNKSKSETYPRCKGPSSQCSRGSSGFREGGTQPELRNQDQGIYPRSQRPRWESPAGPPGPSKQRRDLSQYGTRGCNPLPGWWSSA